MIEINKIYNTDCLKGLNLVDDESIDLIVTDPPYLINYNTRYRKDKKHDFCSHIYGDNDRDLLKLFIKESYRVMKNNTAMYLFCNHVNVDFFKQELEKYFNIKNLIVWIKNNHTAGDLYCAFGRKCEFIFLVNKGKRRFNGKRLTDVWNFDRIAGKKQLHQNEKPLDLIKQCIEKHSSENDLILDAFMGSGTTCVACLELNRNYVGFEIDNKYYNIATKRIEFYKKNS